MILAGKYFATLDRNGRFTVPAKFRSVLGNEMVLSPRLGGCECLWLYSQAGWQELQEHLFPTPHARNFLPEVERALRFFGASAEMVAIDNNNRIAISKSLREKAGLKETIVVVGVLDHAEIWSLEAWENYEAFLNSPETQALIQNVVTHPHAASLGGSLP